MFQFVLEATMALMVLSGVFWAGRASVNITRVKEPEPAPPLPDEQLAATDSEITDALSDLNLDQETYAALKARIHTVAQLKATVATISSESCQVALEHLFPLAHEYVRSTQANPEDPQAARFADEMAKSIIIGQFSAPKGVVHPAFASIAMYIKATGADAWPEFAEGMFAQMRERNAEDTSWDMIEPTQRGTIRVKRVTFHGADFKGLPHFDDKKHDNTREVKVCEFDPARTPEELEFWTAVAQANMDWFVNDSHPKYTSLCGGDLLTWTSFFAKANAKRPEITDRLVHEIQQAPVHMPAVKPVAKPESEVVEEEVPLTLDNKSSNS